MRWMRRTVVVSALAVGLAAAWGGVADAGSEPTATPTPEYELNRPDLSFVGNQYVLWSDTSTGEDGYRITMTIGMDTRTFELPPNSIRFEYPSDFFPGCASPFGPHADITLEAFRGDEVSEPAVGTSPGELCPPATVTPSIAATPAVKLPATGGGGDSSPLSGHAGSGALFIFLGGIILLLLWLRLGAAKAR
jgi:hypothetical protein